MLDDLLIRPAAEEERERLGALKLRASLGWGDHAEALLALPEARQVPAEHLPFVLVAERRGEAVGFVTVLPTPDGDAELEDLFVDPDAWRQGVGGRLLAEAERRAVESGHPGLHVVANRRALRFYEAAGFRITGTVQTLFEPAPEMRKDLG